MTQRCPLQLVRGYARTTFHIHALPKIAKRRRNFSGTANLVVDDQEKSTQMLTEAIRILGASTCDEAVARVALELALREAEAEKQLAIQEVESEMKLAIKDAESEMKMAIANKEADMKNKIALLRYKYAAVSSRFWLEKLFADILSFAVEKKWENFESMSNSKGRLSMTAINGYLRSRPKKWQRFVAAHDLETTISREFPELPSKTLLYGA